MNRRHLIAAGLSLSLALAACGEERQPVERQTALDLPGFFDCIRETDAVLVSAHRAGPSRGLPENALETINALLELGPAMVEVDVRTTRDGVLVLMHDETLNRTTTGNGSVASKTYADLASLRLLDPDGARTPYPIPTLREAILAVKGRGILSIDTKGTDFGLLLDVVDKTDAMAWVSFITYSVNAAAHLRRMAPDAMISVTIKSEQGLRSAQDRLGDLSRITAWTGTGDPNPRLYRALDQAGVEVSLGTFGSADRQRGNARQNAYRDLHDRGVDIIATNEPRAAMASLPMGRVSTCLLP